MKTWNIVKVGMLLSVQIWFEFLNKMLLHSQPLCFIISFHLINRKDFEFRFDWVGTVWNVFTNIEAYIADSIYLLSVNCYPWPNFCASFANMKFFARVTKEGIYTILHVAIHVGPNFKISICVVKFKRGSLYHIVTAFAA